MLPSDVQLFSVDDHSIEPPTLWLDRLPTRYHDVAPRIERIDGRDTWVYEDMAVKIERGVTRSLPEFAGNREPFTDFEQMRPGCYDPIARLADMDQDRVWAQLAFPNFPRFAGHRFLPAKDKELALLCIRAYNDFVLDDWAGADPERLLGMAVLPLWDPQEAAREVERTAAKGARAIAFSENPTVLGLPSIHTNHWDPVWAAASEAGLPVCIHIGSSSKHHTTSDDAPPQVMLTLLGVNAMMTCADWMFSGLFDRFPALRIVLSEGGAGWAPHIIERAEKIHHHFLTESADGDDGSTTLSLARSERSPAEIFKQHIHVCMIHESFALGSLDFLPVDNLLWETDFPHMDSLWPHSRKLLEEAMVDVPDDDCRKIGELNARALFNLPRRP